MRKKKNHRIKLSEESVTGSKEEHSISSSSSYIEDKSADENNLIQNFKVLIDKKYLKWIRSNWKNVALLHPSIINSFSNCKYVLVVNRERNGLCIVFPFSRMKETIICFPKDSLGYEHGDAVHLHPYPERINRASEVLISLNPPFNSGFKDIILRNLRNRFFTEGTFMKFRLFETSYEFTVLHVTSEESTDVSQISHSYLTDICSISNLSLNDSDSFNLANSSRNHFHLPGLSSTPHNYQYEKVPKSFCDTSDINSSVNCECKLYSKYYVISDNTDITLNSSTKESEQNYFDENRIIGLCKQLQTVKSIMESFLKPGNKSIECRTLMFLGPSGTGKTLLMETIIASCDLYTEKIYWYDLYSKPSLEAEKDLRIAFKRAVKRSPSVIVFDDVNHLLPSKTDGNKYHLHILNSLSLLIEELENKKVLLIVLSNSDFDDTPFKANGRVFLEIKFPLPNIEERKRLFQQLLEETKHSLTSEDINDCAELFHGFTMKDIKNVVSKAENLTCVKNSLNPSENYNLNYQDLTFSDIKMICKLNKTKSLSGSNLKVKKIFWEDIGGMMKVKEKLKKIVQWPLKYPEIFKRLNVTPSKGVLMYGPPGCSKTMIAKALATEFDLNFISKNASDLFHKYVGESEKAVRDLFVLAKVKSPCIIFLDEIDALVAERGSCSSGSGVGDRIVTTLLTEIDGVEELHGVLILAATNRPDMLDDALIRNGRIDHFIYVPLPDNKARLEILKLQMKDRTVADAFNFEYLSEKTEGYTGAEIVNVCNEAALQLLAEDITAECPVFTMQHFEKAMHAILPRTTKEMIDFYEQFNSKFGIKQQTLE